jgi:hypothetical protein
VTTSFRSVFPAKALPQGASPVSVCPMRRGPDQSRVESQSRRAPPISLKLPRRPSPEEGGATLIFFSAKKRKRRAVYRLQASLARRRSSWNPVVPSVPTQ